MVSKEKKSILFFNLTVCIILLSAVIFSLGVVYAAADVAYIYDKSFNIDNNIIQVFNNKNLSVDKIQVSQVSQTDFSQYRLIFVGDERFRNPGLIPISKYPSIVSNYYNGKDWGLTDNDGVSKLAGSKPLSVRKNNQVIQVYTNAFFNEGSSVAIPYYYLGNENKAQGFVKHAGTHTGDQDVDLGDVISLANESARLKNGQITSDRICYYGIVESDFWTPAAKQLFEDCVGFVASACFKDSDCGGNFTSELYCNGKDVYKDISIPFCENPGTIESTCSAESTPVLVEQCVNACIGGACVECTEDSHCDDNNSLTEDMCNLDNNTCEHTPIQCNNDNDCEDNNQRTVDECVNPGTTTSFCRNTEVNCLINSDCGFTGFTGQEFCSQDDVYKTYQNATCVNAGTLESNCVVTQQSKLVNECEDNNPGTQDSCSTVNNTTSCIFTPIGECSVNEDCGSIVSNKICVGNNLVNRTITPSCVGNSCHTSQNDSIMESCQFGCSNGACIQPTVACNNNNDCDDSNSQTNDVCVNPGTPQSFCKNDNLQCINDGQCGSATNQLVCNGNSVINRTITPKCIGNTCDSEVNENLVENCAYQCSNGACIQPPVTCYSNNDCNDNNQNTNDVCVNPGTPQSYCTNTPNPVIVCSTNSQCNDNNQYTVDECVNPGTATSFCRNTEVNCLINSDCGFTGFTGQEFCSQDDVYKTYQTSSCVNPGTLESNCVVTQQSKLVNECDDNNPGTIDGCSNAICTHNFVQCTTNSQCGSVVSNNICIGNNVVKRTTTPSCVGNNCQSNTNDVILQSCTNGCSNGACNTINNPVCGNGIKEISNGEECDDGNLINGDGCSSSCQLEGGSCEEICSGGVIDVELVIDRSGSMNRMLEPPQNGIFVKVPKIKGARDASQNFVSEALERNPSTKIGVSSFSSDSRNDIDLTSNFINLNNVISGLYANGNADSNFNQSIRAAVDKLSSQGSPNAPNIIIFLSDGHPTVTYNGDDSGAFVDSRDVQSALDAAWYASDHGVILITVGFGKKTELNETLLMQMAEITGGDYFFVESYPQLLELYSDLGGNTCEIICSPQVTCNNNNDCNDGNAQTQDICVYPGTTNSYCVHNTLQCTTNSQCGSVVSNNICIGNNVVKRTTTPSCVGNNCQSNTNDVILQQCAYGCSNGACIQPPVTCYSNSDCNDNNQNTNDVCVYPGTPQSFCENTPNPTITCSANYQCDDDNQRTVDECVNPGTTTSFCRNTEVNCLINSDCGFTGFTGQEFCSQDDVYKTYQTSSCVNPGTLESNCVVTQTPNKLNECSDSNPSTIDSCSNAICIHDFVQCTTNSQCNDNNQYTQDSCINPGTTNSYCQNIPIACFNNNDCNDSNPQTNDVCINPGTTNSYCQNSVLQCINDGQCGSQTSQLICSGSSVVNKTITPKCIGNSCTSQITNQTVQQCAYGCSNGACIQPPIICSTNSQCNDNNQYTIDSCINPGTPQSYCTNQLIDCITNNDCNDGNAYTEDLCINPGTLQSYCQNNQIICFNNNDCNDGNPQTNDVCINPGTTTSFCENNVLQCINDGQCGSVVSNNICVGDNVVNRTITPLCIGNNCQSSTNDVIIQNCAYGCSNGACIQPPITCSTNSQCNDNNQRTVDECVNAGTPQSFCRNTEVNCLENLDCGVTGFVGNEFCSSEDVYKKYQTATCENPGTLESNCVVTQQSKLVNECDDNDAHTIDSCLEDDNTAICVNELLECLEDEDCGETISEFVCIGDARYNRTITPGCSGDNECTLDIDNEFIEICEYGCYLGECLPQIVCNADSDCGEDSISENYCVETGVYHNIIDYTCLNPGTPQSSCNINVTEELVEECSEMCFEGSCVDIACFTDSDCNDGERLTLDYCRNPGTVDSFCENIPIICKRNRDCDDGNASTQDICRNPGTVDSFCRHKPIVSCGNGIVDSGEQCDDGNLASGDGCSSSCLVETCEEICEAKPIDFDLQIDRSLSTLMPFGYLGYADPIQIFLITGPPKIWVEKTAAIKFVDVALRTNPNNRIGISAFSSSVTNVRDLTNNRQNLKEGIWTINVFGTTDYYESIVSGVDKLNSQSGNNRQKIIIFVSDGQPNGLQGIDRAIEAAEYAKLHNVKIYTIGVDGILHVNAPLLIKMAKISGGKYYFASSSRALMDIYERFGEETCEVICEA